MHGLKHYLKYSSLRVHPRFLSRVPDIRNMYSGMHSFITYQVPFSLNTLHLTHILCHLVSFT
jgi:hypothetical protein